MQHTVYVLCSSFDATLYGRTHALSVHLDLSDSKDESGRMILPAGYQLHISTVLWCVLGCMSGLAAILDIDLFFKACHEWNAQFGGISTGYAMILPAGLKSNPTERYEFTKRVGQHI